MRAGIAAGRALVSSLHCISHHPQFLKPPSPSSSPCLLPKPSSIADVFREEHHGVELRSSSSLWSQCSAPFASEFAMDGYRRSPSCLSVSGLEGASLGWSRPRAQNHVFLQGLATQTSTESPTRPPLDSKAFADSKVSPTGTSSPPPPPPSTDTGRPSEELEMRKSGIVRQMMSDFGAVPFPALVLGAAGLIPFVALAPPLVHMLPLPDIVVAAYADAQAAYGASIVSFLGAIHWGLAMADYAAPGKGGVANMTLMTSRYVWSVVPSLMAWTALLLPSTTKFAVLIFSLWMALGVDFLFARMKLVPHWFLSLRWPLTFVATVSMVPSLVAAAAWPFET